MPQIKKKPDITRLKQVRLDKGWGQQYVCELVNAQRRLKNKVEGKDETKIKMLQTGHLWRIENGKMQAGSNILRQLSEVYRLPMEDLMGSESDAPFYYRDIYNKEDLIDKYDDDD